MKVKKWKKQQLFLENFEKQQQSAFFGAIFFLT